MREDLWRRNRRRRELLFLEPKEMTTQELEEVVAKLSRTAKAYQRAVETSYQRAEEAEAELWKRKFKLIKNENKP